MKKIFFVISLICLNYAHADDPQLMCQIVNLGNNRVVDQKLADYPITNKPILLMMGVGQLTGIVRDTVGATPNDRKLNLQLSYGFPGDPNSNGMSIGQATYKLDQAVDSRPLAEVEMTDPGFPVEYSLQCFLIK